MNSTEARPSSKSRFALRENSTVKTTPESERFLIRPESVTHRSKAIFDFEKEAILEAPTAPVQALQKTKRPGIAELLINAEKLLNAGEKSAAGHLIRQALALDSQNTEAMKKMLRTLGDQEWEQKQKLTLLKTLAYLQPDFDNYARYGQALLDGGELDLALEAFFDATLRVEDENSLLFEVYKNMGNIYVRKGDFDSAEESYHKAFALTPDSDVLQVNLGTLSVQKQDWSEAQDRFRKALELNSLNDKAWVGMGLCHYQVGEAHLAQATLENALDICPANRTAVHLMASWSLQANSVDRAVERLQDYLATQESDVDMSLVLIHLFCHQQKLDLAKIELERALCWEPMRGDLVQLAEKFQEAA